MYIYYVYGLKSLNIHLCLVDGPFDCEAMCAYLMKNHDVLKNLPYNKMELELVADDVIPYHEKLVMESQRNDAQMCTVLNYVRTNLHHKYPKKFKSILQVMENSDDPSLKVTAKSLG